MSPWRQLCRGLFALTNRAAADREIDDELRDFLDRATEAHQARGLSPAEARREARLEMGSLAGAREQVREHGWENAVEALWTDLRHAVRRLRAEPVFTVTAVLTLALGLGGTTAIFSAASPILFEPLPYPGAGRVTAIWEVGADGARNDASFGMVRELAERSRSFEAMALFKPWRPALTAEDHPERFEGQRVSAAFLQVLGVPPALGRDFQAEEDRLDGAAVVLLSHGLWQRRFGGDDAVLGRSITLDDQGYTVIGVMPASFENVVSPSVELWAPLQYDLSQGRAWGHHLRTIGRLRDGVSLVQATAELDELGKAVLVERRPPTYGREVGFQVSPLLADVTRGARPVLLALLGAVTLLLAIASVNVTNLILGRDARRRGELGLRAALGAGHGRLIRQQLTESLLLAAVGGLAGVGVARLLVEALVALCPPDLPRLSSVGVSASGLVFSLAVTLLAGLAFGLAPALKAAGGSHPRSLQQTSRRTTGAHRGGLAVLVVVQVGLALVLLVGSGLLLKSLDRLLAVDAGFEASNLLTMQLPTSTQRFASDSARQDLFRRALEAVRRVPGVEAAALTSQLPLSGDLDLYGVRFDPEPIDDPGEVRGSFRYAVSPGHLEAMGIPLKSGRFLDEHDRADAAPVALISASMAKRRLAGIEPIGQRLQIGSSGLYTVVGVVGDVRQVSLAEADTDAVYLTAAQGKLGDPIMSLVVRTDGNALALAPAVRLAVWSADAGTPVARVRTMSELLLATAAERRFALIDFEAFALSALVLAAAGIYGVLAGAVSERSREIGVRGALGATRGRILALVVGQGMTLAALGAGAGLVAAAVATRALEALLFGVSRFDPATYLAVVALLAGVALVACGLPAWRASRVDPASTLRSE